MSAPVTDPQADVDEDVHRHRRIHTWLGYAAEHRAMADTLTNHGDPGGALLATARARVRDQGASVLRRQPDPALAARQMMGRARVLTARLPARVEDTDTAAAYVTAWTWQVCARELDPGLPVVTPPWDK